MATYKGHNEDSSGNLLLSIGNGMTATVETGSTASQAYTKGAYIFFNNRFCKATKAISSGATLTIGNNLSETSVGAELTSHLRSSDGKEFYFDLKDGSYGYYPSASKVASEFVPFGGTTPEFISFGGNRTQSEVTLSTNGHTEGYLICASTTYDINTWQDINTISGCDKVEIYRNAMTPAYAANSTSIQVFKITNAGSTISFKPPYVLGCGVFMVL